MQADLDMCSYNIRKTKSCKVSPRHEFKEVKYCDAAKARGNILCDENTWEDLEGVMRTATSIVCAVCNGLVYTIVQAEQAAPAGN